MLNLAAVLFLLCPFSWYITTASFSLTFHTLHDFSDILARLVFLFARGAILFYKKVTEGMVVVVKLKKKKTNKNINFKKKTFTKSTLSIKFTLRYEIKKRKKKMINDHLFLISIPFLLYSPYVVSPLSSTLLRI